MKNKRIIINFVISIVLVFVVSIFCNKTEASSYKIDNYNIDAKINKDGSMHVIENIKYSFEERMNGLKRNILYKYTYKDQKNDMSPTSSRYQANGINNMNVYVSDYGFNSMKKCEFVSEAKNGMDGVYTGEYSRNEMALKVYSPISLKTKYVKYEYDIDSVAVKYNDMGEIYWNFIGGDWECDISNAIINITFDENVNFQDVKFYPHTYAKHMTKQKMYNKITIEVNNINSGVAVDCRVVFPGDAINLSSKSISENYDYNQLDKIEKSMEFDRNRKFISEYILIFIVIAAILIVIYFIIKTSILKKRHGVSKNDINYYRDIIDGFPLSDYSIILSKTHVVSNNNLITATILDLVDKGYLLMEPKKKKKKDIFSSNDYEYHISLNEEKDINELNDFEIRVVNILFNSKYSNDRDISSFNKKQVELEDAFKKYGYKSTEVSKYYTHINKLNSSRSKDLYSNISSKVVKEFLIFLAILLVLLAVDILAVSPLNFELKMIYIIPSIFCSIFYTCTVIATIRYKCNIIKEEYKEEYLKLLGLKKYLKDYSRIKDRYPMEVTLWNRYLVFATLFGIADKVSKEFKDELLSKGYDNDYIYMNYPIINFGIYSSSINSYIATSTGTSSSSGGFSGGGSGGGGRRWTAAVVLSNEQNLYF